MSSASASPPARSTRTTRARARRERVERELGGLHGGAAALRELRALGLTKAQVAAELVADRWPRVGPKTVSLTGRVLTPEGAWWRALVECGPQSFLDGTTALVAGGLVGWSDDAIHVGVPKGARCRRPDGVRVHEHRDPGRRVGVDWPRAAPEVAAIRAAQWARSDRQAATVLAMTMQQGLVRPDVLMDAWRGVVRSPRRAVLDQVIPLVCRGAQALSELDFARLCRRRGLPQPSRQVVVQTASGRQYLDARFEAYGVTVEVNGVQHYRGLAVVTDALRRNERSLEGDVALELPALGLVLDPHPLMEQVERALRAAGWRQGS